MVRTAIPCDKRLKHQSNGSRRRGATTQQTDNCLWTHDGEQWQTSFFSHHIRRDERAQTTPEHICTETSKNHNRFQSRLRSHHFLERDSLSHFCYSYVHVRLADGIPPRKALVMNGENVSNDVDEEVYAGDGA